MRILVNLLLFAVTGVAQSAGGGCGAATAMNAPSNGQSLAARSAPASKPADAEVKQTGDTSKSRTDTAGVLAQIRPRRPFPIQLTVSCVCGSVDASALTATSTSQEIPIVTGIAGTFRFEHVLVQEVNQFAAAGVTSLNVSAGRPGNRGELIAPFALMSPASPQNFWFDRPAPPQITGTYNLVLNFTGSTTLGSGGTSNFKTGTVNWEVCGYDLQQ